MKLILAVVPNDDSIKATSALTKEGFIVTRLATTGGFLMVGNTTLLIGTDDSRIPLVKDILKKYCSERKQVNDSTSSYGRGMRTASPRKRPSAVRLCSSSTSRNTIKSDLLLPVLFRAMHEPVRAVYLI